ncbi:hypothetical protein D3C80_970990 [compost metagenome]
MAVAAFQTVGVTDAQPVAIAAPATGLDHHAVGGRHDGRAGGGGEVHALVHLAIARDGVGADAEVRADTAEAGQRRAHHGGARVLAGGVEIFRRLRAWTLIAVEGVAFQLGVKQVAGFHRAARLGHRAVEDQGELVRSAHVALHVELVGEQLAGAADDRRGGAQFTGAGRQRALDLVVGDDGFARDLFVKRTQAQGAVKAARHCQLAGRAGAHGQADQAGVAPAAARLGDGGFKLQTGAHVLEVEGAGDGGGDSAGFLGADAGAAHGLLEGFTATNLDRDGLRGRQTGRRAGGGIGLGLEIGDLFRRQRRNFLGAHGFIGLARHKGDGHGGSGRQEMRRKPHRLAARIELSHRSPAIDDAVLAPNHSNHGSRPGSPENAKRAI